MTDFRKLNKTVGITHVQIQSEFKSIISILKEEISVYL